MIRIEVIQGDNKIESVYVDRNDLGVISVLINYEKRWCEWTTGCGGDDDGVHYESFYICDHEDSTDWRDWGRDSEVKIYHDGELNKLHQVTTQCKDQLHTLYLPYELVDDGEMLASWDDRNVIDE